MTRNRASAKAAGAVSLTVAVYGTPVPQGSMKHIGHGRIISARKGLRAWRDLIAATVAAAHTGPAIDGPVHVELHVVVARPASHYGTGRNARVLKATAPRWPISQKLGDIDKHARSVLDGLVDGGVLTDDSRVVALHVDMSYADGYEPGVNIHVRELPA